MTKVQTLVKEMISKIASDDVFSIYDLEKCGGYEAVKKALLRLEESGIITHLYRGLYIKEGKENEILLETAASAIARKHGWTIAPSGEECINIIGLRDIPYDSNKYISSGTYRTYVVKGETITFRHVATKDILALSYKAVVVVNALKTIGMNNITKKDRKRIREYLTCEDKARLKKECAKCTKWVYKVILDIIGGDKK